MEYGNIPDRFLQCLVTRRHILPLDEQSQQRVRLRFGPGRADTLDCIEYVGTCSRCGTKRTMLRTDNAENEFLEASYTHPDGYLAPPGTPYEPAELRREWWRRTRPTGKAVVREVTGHGRGAT